MRGVSSVKLCDELNRFFVIVFETQRELGYSKSYSFFLFNFLLLKQLQCYFYTLNILFFGKIFLFKTQSHLPPLKPDMNLNKLK